MILKRPLISEKSMNIAKLGLYTFEVSKDATKKAIAKLIADKFKVTVLSVKTINTHQKVRLQKSRKGYFSISGIKKALVQVKKGDKIALFEQASKGEETQVKTAETEAVKEKKSLLKGTKVRIEKSAKESKNAKVTTGKKQEKTKTAKEKSIAKKKVKK